MEMTDAKRVAIIESGLQSEFWKEVLKPLLEDRMAYGLKSLRNPSLMRKHEVPDAYICGILDTVEMLLSQPKLLAESIKQADAAEIIAQQQEQADDLIAHFGRGWQE